MSQTRLSSSSSSPTTIKSNLHDGISTNCDYNLLDVRPYREEYVLVYYLKNKVPDTNSWIYSGRECKIRYRSQGRKRWYSPVSSACSLRQVRGWYIASSLEYLRLCLMKSLLRWAQKNKICPLRTVKPGLTHMTPFFLAFLHVLETCLPRWKYGAFAFVYSVISWYSYLCE